MSHRGSARSKKRKKNWDSSSSTSAEDSGDEFDGKVSRQRANSAGAPSRITAARRVKLAAANTQQQKIRKGTSGATKTIKKKGAAARVKAAARTPVAVGTVAPILAQTRTTAAPMAWTPQRHVLKEGQKVKLAPHVRLKGDRVAGLEVGRTRTPSPFGAKMGDHTGAWTTVVDDVHALVYGKTLAEAYQAVSRRQTEVEAWTADPNSLGRRLWDLDADLAARQPVMETYAAEVRDALKGTPTAEGLAKAIAHHLAFRNFLPYATVPAKGKIGSKGSGEGAARAAALVPDLAKEAQTQRDEETKEQRTRRLARENEKRHLLGQLEARRQLGEPEAVTRERLRKEKEAEDTRKENIIPKAREGLWKLFSFDAAIREAIY
jgi:hypothetical protein